MKNISFKKILIIVTVVIMAIGLLCGLYVSVYMISGLENLPKLYVDGSDFAPVIKVFGYMILPFISIFIVFFALFISGIIWAIYGVIKLIAKLITKIL